MKADRVIAAAREYLGTPFHHQGRQKNRGLDCAGLIECVARDLGYSVPVHDGYARTPYNGLFEQRLSEYMISDVEKQPGCVILIKFMGMDPSHTAIYTGKTIIHAYESAGRCVEHAYDKKWQRMTVRAYGWPRG